MKHENFAKILHKVQIMELHMSIKRRWQPTDTQYIAVTRNIARRQYHRTLDNLYRLVVQRMFELDTMNIANTGDETTCTIEYSTDI